MEIAQLDLVLVPVGLLVFGIYHVWLVITIKRDPSRTVIGLNAQSCRQWVFSMMTEPLKNGALIIQTIRNNIMASTLLATTAITLSSIITVLVSNTSNSASDTSSRLVYGNKSGIMSSVKYFTLILCFMVAFMCNVQSIRYYAHVSFLSTLPTSQGKRVAMEYAARNLSLGSLFWSIGLRAFYLSFILFLWLFGPIPMCACSCAMSVVLYFLDTTSSLTRQLHYQSLDDNSV